MGKLTFKAYFDALREGKLLGLKCKACGKITCPPMSVCQECGADELEVVEMRNSGVIRTFTVIHVPPAGLEGEAPYVVCEVETDDGPWLVGRLDIKPEEASVELVGRRVTITGQELPPERHYPDKERRVVPLFKLS